MPDIAILVVSIQHRQVLLGLEAQPHSFMLTHRFVESRWRVLHFSLLCWHFQLTFSVLWSFSFTKPSVHYVLMSCCCSLTHLSCVNIICRYNMLFYNSIIYIMVWGTFVVGWYFNANHSHLLEEDKAFLHLVDRKAILMNSPQAA